MVLSCYPWVVVGVPCVVPVLRTEVGYPCTVEKRDDPDLIPLQPTPLSSGLLLVSFLVLVLGLFLSTKVVGINSGPRSVWTSVDRDPKKVTHGVF